MNGFFFDIDFKGYGFGGVVRQCDGNCLFARRSAVKACNRESRMCHKKRFFRVVRVCNFNSAARQVKRIADFVYGFGDFCGDYHFRNRYRRVLY